mgnify:CR=1 FL=1
MALTKDEQAYLKALVKREWKHLKSEEKMRETDTELWFYMSQEKYEKFVKGLLKKL